MYPLYKFSVAVTGVLSTVGANISWWNDDFIKLFCDTVAPSLGPLGLGLGSSINFEGFLGPRSSSSNKSSIYAKGLGWGSSI